MVGFIVRWSRRVASTVAFVDAAVILTVLLAAPAAAVLWVLGCQPNSTAVAVLVGAGGVWLVLLSLLLRSVWRAMRPPRV